MPIDVKKYIDVDSEDTPIIRYVEKNVAEKRYGVDVTDLLGPVNANGGYDYPNGGHALDLSALTYGVGEHAFAYKFYKSSITGDVTINIFFARDGSFLRAFEQSGITAFYADRLLEIKDNKEVFWRAFQDAYRLKKVSFKNLGQVYSIDPNSNNFRNAFTNTPLEDANFESLMSIYGNYAFLETFKNTKISKNPMPNVESIGGTFTMSGVFSQCPNIESFVFGRLKYITGAPLISAFSGDVNLRELSFPKLLAVTGNSAFMSMLSGCSNVTVHFPSNMQEVIGEWADVINGFGGTNTTVLFDLPETE